MTEQPRRLGIEAEGAQEVLDAVPGMRSRSFATNFLASSRRFASTRHSTATARMCTWAFGIPVARVAQSAASSTSPSRRCARARLASIAELKGIER